MLEYGDHIRVSNSAWKCLCEPTGPCVSSVPKSLTICMCINKADVHVCGSDSVILCDCPVDVPGTTCLTADCVRVCCVCRGL